MAKKKEEKTIRLQIIQSYPSNFYIKDLDEIKCDDLSQRDVEFNVKIHIGTNLEDKNIRIEVDIDALLKRDNSSLFGIRGTSVFHSPDYKYIVNNENDIIAPEEFIRKLLNISIGGVRGMLAVNLLNTELNHITLPLMDLGSVEEEN